MSKHKRSYVDDQRSITHSEAFYVYPSQTSGFEIDGPGKLDTLLLVSDSGKYQLVIDSGVSKLIDDDYTALKSDSDNLPHVSAYTTSSGKYVLVVQGYYFHDYITIRVYPHEAITFDHIRDEYTLEREVNP